MRCRLCGQERKLIKAHIIPEAFFRPLRSGPIVPELHTNTEGAHPKRSPIGIYDKKILCVECDARFAPRDDHAQQVLIRRFSEKLALFSGSEKVGYKILDLDYKLLKLFFLGLLWRASVSTQPFYRRISLGPYENILRTMILANNPGRAEEFAVTLAKFSNPELTAMLDPHPNKFEGINYCQFYITGFVAYIKVDRRPVPLFLKDFLITQSPPIVVLLRDLDGSRDGAIMKEIAGNAIRKGIPKK
jgi:hypothetical protein